MKKKSLELLNEARKYAGLEPIIESFDDDEDPDVKKVMADKRQQEFERKNKKTLDKDAEAIRAAKKKADAGKTDTKKDDKEDGEKKAPVEKKEPEKKDDKESGNSEKVAKEKKAAAARAWIKDNPNATAGQFKAISQEKFGIGKHYANTFWYAEKAKAKRQAAGEKTAVAECFVLSHPQYSGYYLAENKMMNQYQWVDEDSDIEALIYETSEEAEKAASMINDWRGTPAKVTRVIFD